MYIEEFINKTNKSKQAYDEAKKYLAGGVSASGRFMKPYPIFIKKAEGCRVTDLDDNEYIDMLLGNGTHILGYNNDIILSEVKKVIKDKRSSLTFISQDYEIELAKCIVRNLEPMEMLRFVSTGTEASTMCVRAAMAYTGKEKMAKFEGHYHGSTDILLISGASVSGSEQNPLPVKDCAGIPSGVMDNVIILPFNKKKECENIIEKYSSELGAIILEPVTGFRTGCVPIEKEFLSFLRKITYQNKIVLIFDEIVTGFRIALGGASEYFGIEPDMIALGKTIGGGFPIGCYGGKKEIMEKVVIPTKEQSDLSEKIFQSGTFSGHPVSMVAGKAAIEEIEKGKIIPYINELGEYVRNNIKDIARKLKKEIKVTGICSMFQVHFCDHDINNKRDAINTDKKSDYEFSLRLLNNGIYLPPSHPALISYAHSKSDIDNVLNKIEKVLSEMN